MSDVADWTPERVGAHGDACKALGKVASEFPAIRMVAVIIDGDGAVSIASSMPPEISKYILAQGLKALCMEDGIARQAAFHVGEGGVLTDLGEIPEKTH